MKNNQLWALRWHPHGFSNTFSAFIIAEDTVEANFLWHKFKKGNSGVRHTWDRAFNNCLGRTTMHIAEPCEEASFKEQFPRKRKVGVYLCKEEAYGSDTTDHVRD